LSILLSKIIASSHVYFTVSQLPRPILITKEVSR